MLSRHSRSLLSSLQWMRFGHIVDHRDVLTHRISFTAALQSDVNRQIARYTHSGISMGAVWFKEREALWSAWGSKVGWLM